ncbi:hypothetical protein [Stenotrophomonas maltophilia]|uniref:hypothetical protein n=1 Tax=Stenotrophomonas maltophilia TaxID=40324 RepID=UPI0039F726E2
MAREPVRWINVVLMWTCIAIGFVSAYALALYPVRIWVDKEAGQIWPAWVQAVGSIAAIIAAALIARWQRRSEMQQKELEELAKARSMASFLYKDFSRWAEKAEDVEGPVVMFGVDGYTIPQTIYDHMRDLHVIGPIASEAATKAIGASLMARKIGRSGNDGVKRYLKDQESVDRYNAQLLQIRSSCANVLDQFDILLGIPDRASFDCENSDISFH